jgi:hypothetical protein
MKTTIYYMHTLDNRPAYYDGQQIVFAMKSRPLRLCSSLRDVRMQQRLSDRWRLSQGFQIRNYDQDYKRVRLP